MQTINYQSLKISPHKNEVFNDSLLIEAPLQININNKPYTVVMRTPNNDFELIRGLLYAEDIYKEKKPLEFNIEQKENNTNSIINVNIDAKNLGKGYLNKRTLLSVSSCGICGKKELSDLNYNDEKLNFKNNFSVEEVFSMMDTMSKAQHHFKKSGGAHAAAIFSKNNSLLSIKEDIGRHNATDKVIGDLLIKNTLEDANFLLVSGRVSYEIVTKAFIAKIPIIIAVSACSSLAVDFAKEFGICVIGFTRNNKMTVYSNPQHLKNKMYV